MQAATLNRRLARARDALTDPATSPSIDEVARLAGMSPFHFSRMFRAVFGESPHQYRIRSRIRRARELLLTTDLDVTDVCHAVGFTSLGSFSAAFSRRVGLAPTAWRAKHRPDPAIRGLPPTVAHSCLALMGAGSQVSRSEPDSHT